MTDKVFYNTTWFSTFIGAAVSLISIFFGNWLNNKVQEKQKKKDVLMLISQNNPRLFSLIYKGAISPSNLNYSNLRKEIEKNNILYLLPPELKEPFKELYKIHYKSPEYYNENKNQIPKYASEIVDKLEEIGVDYLDYK